MITKSIALIGGTGFIGKNFIDFFLNDGYEILVIGRSIDDLNYKENCSIKLRSINVNDTSKLVEELINYENIIWLVSDSVPNSTTSSLVDDFSANVAPIIKLLESTSSLINLKRFVFMSSGGTIYGNPEDQMFFDEDSSKNPLSGYGLSKLITEEYIQFLSLKLPFQIYILRPSNVYGNHQNLKKPQGIVGYAYNAAIKGEPLIVYGEGSVVRDFIHVLDLAEAVKLCIENQFNESKCKIYNIGSNEGFSIKQILNMINVISGVCVEQIQKPIRPIDCKINVLNCNKIKAELEWIPKIGIKDGLESVWDWMVVNH